MSNQPVKVLIVDDSSVSRELLSFIIQSDTGLQLVGSATNGEEGVEMLIQLEPDVVVMDIVMPKMNGFEATKKIMEIRPTPIIIISGVFNREEVEKSFDAIHAGALTIIEKPRGVGDAQYLETARFVIRTIKALSETKDKKNHFKEHNQQVGKSINMAQEQTVSAICIGASIGGPQTLATLLSSLPASFPVPIYVAQHISTGFIEGFANWLDKTTPLTIKIGSDGEQALPGYVYLPPDGMFLKVNSDHTLTISPSDDKHSSHSSINTLMSSVAENFGRNAIGILLTGTGTDGVNGLLEIKNRGGISIVQDPTNAVISDLPLAAISVQAADHIESIEKIASSLPILIKKPVGAA